MKFLIYLFTLSFCLALRAEFNYLARSNEGLMMGDAYTAVSDDETTLFYNPAALGRNHSVHIVPLKPNLAFPDILDKELSLDNPSFGVSNRFEDFPKDPEGIANRVLGYPLYLQFGYYRTVKMLNFAFNYFSNSKTNMQLQNAIYPSLSLDYRLDRGFIMGYAYTFGSGKFGKNPIGHQTSIGASVKKVNRQGIKSRFDLFGTTLLDAIQNSSDYKTIRNNLGYSKGSGLGFDLGLEHTYYAATGHYTIGLSYLDIGDTSFSREEGTYEIPDQEQSLNLGTSYFQKIGILDYTIAADYSNILDARTPTIAKFKFGGRVRTPFINLYTGWNGGYISWGVGLNIFIFNLQLGFYGIELGQNYRENEGKRTVISLSLAEINLDLF